MFHSRLYGLVLGTSVREFESHHPDERVGPSGHVESPRWNHTFSEVAIRGNRKLFVGDNPGETGPWVS